MVRQWLLTILDDASSPLLGLVDVSKLRALAQSDQGNIPWFGQLMNKPQLFAYLIQVDIWLRRYKVEFI